MTDKHIIIITLNPPGQCTHACMPTHIHMNHTTPHTHIQREREDADDVRLVCRLWRRQPRGSWNRFLKPSTWLWWWKNSLSCTNSLWILCWCRRSSGQWVCQCVHRKLKILSSVCVCVCMCVSMHTCLHACVCVFLLHLQISEHFLLWVSYLDRWANVDCWKYVTRADNWKLIVVGVLWWQTQPSGGGGWTEGPGCSWCCNCAWAASQPPGSERRSVVVPILWQGLDAQWALDVAHCRDARTSCVELEKPA